MAEFRERQDGFAHDDNRLELADILTLAAKIAFFHIHFGNRGVNDPGFMNFGPDEEVSIWLLHIAVQKLNIAPKRNGQVRGDRCLARTALSACYTDNHHLLLA
jgi:hypothetical protein